MKPFRNAKDKPAKTTPENFRARELLEELKKMRQKMPSLGPEPTHAETADRLKLLQKEANDMLATLPPREQEVLKMRFGLEACPLTLEEIGLMFKVTRERVRQIEAKALRRLFAIRKDNG